MNLGCVICADLLIPSDDVYVTNCGHIFHYVCLYQWLERSKSCPQCRHKCNERNIHKVYFNIQNLDASSIDVASIQQELYDTKLRITEKEKELKQASEEIDSLKSARKKCKKTISGLERELAEKEFLIYSYDEQLKHLKADNKLIDDLRKEVTDLKAQNQLMTTIQDVLSSTSTEVESLLKDGNNMETLCIMVAALKRELQISEKRKNEIRESLKSVQSDLRREQKQKEGLQERVSHLESVNYRLTEEARSLSRKDSELSKNEVPETPILPSMQIVNQQIDSMRKTSLTFSPNLSERIKIIEESTSPYFNIKSSSIGLSNLLKNNENMRNKDQLSNDNKFAQPLKKTTSDLSEKYSIFKKPRLEVQLNVRPNVSNLSFNGVGGSEKTEEYPDFAKRKPICDMSTKSIAQRIKSGQLKKPKTTFSKATLDSFLKKV